MMLACIHHAFGPHLLSALPFARCAQWNDPEHNPNGAVAGGFVMAWTVSPQVICFLVFSVLGCFRMSTGRAPTCRISARTRALSTTLARTCAAACPDFDIANLVP